MSLMWGHRQACRQLMRIALFAITATIGFFVTLVPSSQSRATTGEVMTTERVRIAPTIGQPPTPLYDSQGQLIGYSNPNTTLEFNIPSGLLNGATAGGQFDMSKITSAISEIGKSGQRILRVRPDTSVVDEFGKEILRPGQSAQVPASAVQSGAMQPTGVAGNSPGADRANEQIQSGRISPQPGGSPGSPAQPGGAPAPSGGSPARSAGEISTPSGGRFLGAPTCDCVGGGCRFTSGFGPRRSVRTSNGRMSSSNHQGCDIAGGAGSKIVAAADGCVRRIGRNRNAGYGLEIHLDHRNGFVTQYAHLQRFAASVREGACFRKGDVIGFMGSTGNSTGPHLHFGLFHNGRPVDPRQYMSARTNADVSKRCSELASSASPTSPGAAPAAAPSSRPPVQR
ncbi:MAG TPA: peptidoglycan DD-metalloendopeptidase family protein [Pseudobdellovibrionaceae bacterium]|nr:peptidoglycan DD-metalloendopeptidase family protein [Pseudobdellovibrionaceae bacterium]